MRGDAGSIPIVLADRVGDGANATIFALEDPATELAKLYLDADRQPQLSLLGRHLKRAFGDVTTAVPGAPLMARPTYELYAMSNSGPFAGFMMHRFGEPQGWISLEAAGSDPALAQSPEWCLTVARTLARDVTSFHSRLLVVGDLSDTNIRVNHRGAVAWIDIDSFGALACDGLAEVVQMSSTPECRAPELISGGQPCTQESDTFALALQIVRLLTCHFLHPFAIERIAPPGSRTLEDRVEDLDSWLLDPASFKTSEVMHRGVDGWPDPLARACRAALAPGGTRPDASHWMTVLEAITPQDLRDALRGHLPGTHESDPAFEHPPMPRARRRRLIRAVSVVLIVLGVAALVAAAFAGVVTLHGVSGR